MTLKEYIEGLGYDDPDQFFRLSLQEMSVDYDYLPQACWPQYLDYEIMKIEYHMWLDRGESETDENKAYYIITLYAEDV